MKRIFWRYDKSYHEKFVYIPIIRPSIRQYKNDSSLDAENIECKLRKIRYVEYKPIYIEIPTLLYYKCYINALGRKWFPSIFKTKYGEIPQ